MFYSWNSQTFMFFKHKMKYFAQVKYFLSGKLVGFVFEQYMYRSDVCIKNEHLISLPVICFNDIRQ